MTWMGTYSNSTRRGVLYCLDELTRFSSATGKSFRVQHTLCANGAFWGGGPGGHGPPPVKSRGRGEKANTPPFDNLFWKFFKKQKQRGDPLDIFSKNISMELFYGPSLQIELDAPLLCAWADVRASVTRENLASTQRPDSSLHDFLPALGQSLHEPCPKCVTSSRFYSISIKYRGNWQNWTQ